MAAEEKRPGAAPRKEQERGEVDLTLTEFGFASANFADFLEDEFQITAELPPLGKKSADFGDAFRPEWFRDFASPGASADRDPATFVAEVCETYVDILLDDYGRTLEKAEARARCLRETLERGAAGPGVVVAEAELPTVYGSFFRFRSKVPVSLGLLLYIHVIACQISAMLLWESDPALAKEFPGRHPDDISPVEELVYNGQAAIEACEQGIYCRFFCEEAEAPE
jgi:hypothetical protein